MASLTEILAGFRDRRIGVVGDLILDLYTWGNADRVSPEAPVLVLKADQIEARPGGAAGVALFSRSLGGAVRTYGIVGDDGEGRMLTRTLADEAIPCSGIVVDPSRPTTTKHRFMGRTSSRNPAQILRVDREQCEPLNSVLEQQLIDRIDADLDDLECLIVSDYGKGVCAGRLLQAVIAKARQRAVPVVVDPRRGADPSIYRGATILKPNRREAAFGSGMEIGSTAAAMVAAKKLACDHDHRSVVVTLDSDGMVVVEPNTCQFHLPTFPRTVCDVTGAGDMAAAVLGLCAAADVPIREAAELANLASGLEVERIGSVPIRPDELESEIVRYQSPVVSKIVDRSELLKLVRAYRSQNRSIVMTNGCFDLLHAGHLDSLQHAATLGDVLVVAVNGDASVRRLKGNTRPVIGEADRARIVAAIGCVDHVIVFDEDTPCDLLGEIQPDVLAKGGGYAADQVVGREIVEGYGGRICMTPVVAGISTSEILCTSKNQVKMSP